MFLNLGILESYQHIQSNPAGSRYCKRGTYLSACSTSLNHNPMDVIDAPDKSSAKQVLIILCGLIGSGKVRLTQQQFDPK